MDTDEEAGYPRFVTSGRSFVYLLPCRDQDMMKIGFSRDPLQRMHALHRRYFDFFDLDRAVLLEVDRVRDARRIERSLIQHFAEQRVAPPLVVRDAAAGRTEWFCGAAVQSDALVREMAADEDWPLHAPLSAWLRQRFMERADVVYDWASRMHESIQYEALNLPVEAQSGRTALSLRRLLDALDAVHIDIAAVVRPEVVTWYRGCGLP